MVSNPNFYGQSTHGTPNQIEDGVDFPHTGIIKALSDGLGQNYAISGFDITIDSATQIDVGAGVIFRDGKRLAVSAVPNLTLSSTYTNGYHLLVANNHATAPVLEIRSPSGYTAAADKVPAYNTGDTIIAVITHNGTANVGIQYLTVNKTENSLSVGYDDSGYTEMSKITAASGGTTVEVATAGGDFTIDNTDADKKIIMRLGSDDANTDFEVRNNSDAVKFGVDGAGTTTIAGTVNLGSVANAGTDTDKFLVLDSGGNVDFRTGTEVRSDIGAGTLSAESDTLDTVTGRGGTTANDITAGSITSTINQNISYEVVAHPASPIITGGKTVAYIHDIAALGNTLQLPAPASGNILYIKNIFTNPITITGNPLINLNDTTHPKITSASVITLAPFEHVTLQAVNDSQAPLVVGHMIISD